ncbi:PREDICTED: insulin-like peptide INSL5 [Gavialis gangeticus]|uniref:insulin-like peptide INSL5 n=1 Tax=Gavialis gangeticus TaxID=94835 RepID=UPI00092E6E75|nr:PREDICTED: insulin-like peptide INSL5 [Gavialis gangeticus]
MKGTILALVLFSALVAASEVKGEGSFMKLCGRDFVRAVVFTCGGSRWKRHLSDYPHLSEREKYLHLVHGSNNYPESLGHGDQESESLNEEIPNTKTESERDLTVVRQMPMAEKRDVAALLITSCCSIGCTERDISSLC